MYEINILCVKQKGKVPIQYKELCLVKLNKHQNGTKGYAENFEFMSALQGYWYQIFSKEMVAKNDFVCGAWDIVDGIECQTPANYYKELVRDEYDAQFYNDYPDSTSYSIIFDNESIKQSFYAIMKELLMKSRCGMIAVLFRGSLDSPEKIVGDISYSKFVELFDKQEIYENIVYIIHNRTSTYWKLIIMQYSEFIKKLNSGEIRKIIFAVKDYPHYHDCTILWEKAATANYGVKREHISVRLTADKSEKYYFGESFDEEFKLFKIKRVRYTLSEIWDRIVIKEII